MKLLLAATLTLLCISAQAAAPSTIGVHLASRHSSYTSQWNDANLGVYARWDNGFTLGTLRNSYRNQSVYAGWTGEWAIYKSLSAGLTLGAITGYETTVSPMAVPSLRLAVTKNLGVRGSLILNPRKNAPQTMHLSAEWNFK